MTNLKAHIRMEWNALPWWQKVWEILTMIPRLPRILADAKLK